MKNIITELTPYFQTIRQQIHAQPELKYEEFATAQLVATELKKMGLTPLTKIGKTGVVAVLDSGRPGKTLALRADMDALPIQEETNLPYQSTLAGKMHACGHDGHTASLLAAAATLIQIKDKFRGKIKFIFQPAEEGGAGARAMIEAGVLTNPTVDAIFAFHNHPGDPVGMISTKPGTIFYSNSCFTIKIRGKSGHAASPNTAINPITIGAVIAQNIPTLATQLSETIAPLIISITQFNSGVANNIIPETAELAGTIRAATLAKNQQAKEKLEEFVQQITASFGGSVTIEFVAVYPPTINHAAETDFIAGVAKQTFGENNFYIKPLSNRAAEDFSFFLQQVPGCYFQIGNGENSPSCHNAKFDFNDAILPIATEMFCALATEYLK